MKHLIYLSVCLFFLAACNSGPKQWALSRTVDLGDVAPLGMTVMDGDLWLSDSDENVLVRLEEGKVVERLEGFDRPMHIASDEGVLYVPEYGTDTIRIIKNGTRTSLVLSDSLDAPAGVDVDGASVAIADFYKHRILYFDGKDWAAIGAKGKADGDFHYPTDVQFLGNHIYVADAYNNRVQVFDRSGKFLRKIGADQGMNAATGIYVSKQQVFVTDFENDRVLIFGFEGDLHQIIEGDLNKPTDVLLFNGELCIANYKAKRLDFYAR